jgi:large subunit ribosomal protein L30
MIIVIRISGMVDVSENVNHILNNINLRRKYSAILMHETSENVKLLNKIRSFVAYGPISAQNLAKLISLRGEKIDKKEKINAETMVKNLEKKSLREMGMKPFFRLHPPRKGIDSK